MCGHVIRSNMQLPYTAHQIADPLFFRKLEEHAIDPLFSWFSSFVLPCVAFCDCLGRQTANLERWSMATAWTTTLLWKLPQSTSATLGPTTVVDPAGGGGVEGVATPLFRIFSRGLCLLEHTHQPALECCFCLRNSICYTLHSLAERYPLYATGGGPPMATCRIVLLCSQNNYFPREVPEHATHFYCIN